MKDYQNIINYIYQMVDRTRVFEQLEPIDKGSYLSLLCPLCGKRRAYAYQPVNGRVPHIIRCNRESNCGYSATLIEYVAGVQKPRGQAFIDAVNHLAFLAGVEGITDTEDLKAQVINKAPKPMVKPSKDIPLDSETINRYEKMTLTDVGIRYLNQRGISIETATLFGLKVATYGKWPNYTRDKDTGNLVSHRQWFPGRLVVPIYNKKGRLISLYGRAIPGDKQPYKHYRHDFVGHSKGVFNEKAFNEPSVFITEGVIDALSIIEAGKKIKKEYHAAALNGVYGFNWERVMSKNICFAFDPDKAGSTEKLNLATEGKKKGKNIYFLSGKTFNGHGDIAETWEKERIINFQFEKF